MATCSNPIVSSTSRVMAHTMPMTMDSAKRARREGVGGSRGSAVDRLSALPDCLLHAILSFLKAPQVVQTSVLSKRWTDLWRSVPCIDLDINDADFRRTAAAAEGDHHTRKFANFVDNLLLFHDAPTLETFRLRFGGAGRDQSRDADRWIRRAIKYGPAVLEVHLGAHSRDVRLPGLGTCSRGLKRMHLSSLSLDAGFARQIQSGCPVLEDLDLKSCYCTFREISSSTLKILKMDGCSIDVPAADDPDRVFVIRAPALVSLHLVVYSFQFGISVKEADNLVLASIIFQADRDGQNFHKNVRKLLGGLSNVRNLELTFLKTMVPVDDMSEKFPAFSKLRTLLLDSCDLSDNFKTLEQFLHNAPKVEKLTLQNCKLSDDSKRRLSRKKVKAIRKTLKCQNLLTFECSNLKLVEIKGSEGNVQQLFDLLFGIWENLGKATMVLTKD